MELEALRHYLLGKIEATEGTPFGPDALVFKVMGKMFALIAWNQKPLSISLKCDPDLALALRDQYEAVIPGYHLNKRHWNTITLERDVSDDQILEMIDDSYGLVIKGLKKSVREELERNAG